MELLLPIVVGVAAIVAVTVLSQRIGIAAPLLLVLVGVGISFIPAIPDLEIPPELILGVVLPPLLYSTAVNMPAMDFRRDFTTISGLSVALVVITSFAVATVLVLLIPSMPFAIAVAIGAIVSPTDAVATAIVRTAGVSNRLVTVLEGESLLNDATALVLLRAAIAAGAGAIGVAGVAGDFLYAAGVAVAIGFLVGKANLWLRSRIALPTANTAISFIVPFVASLPAEHFGASGLVAAVTAGLVTGHGAPAKLSAEDRMMERTTWRTVELVLEGAVFLIMGLQLSALIDDVTRVHDSWLVALGLGAIVVAIVLAARTGFVSTSIAILGWRMRSSARSRAMLDAAEGRLSTLPDRLDPADGAPTRPSRVDRMRRRVTRARNDLDYYETERLGWREGVILVWAGMRGAVTLAAAQTLPTAVEHRSLLILVAFVVAAGTLLVQGASLGWVARRLGLAGREGPAPQTAAEQLEARRALADAAVARLEDPALRRADGTAFHPATIDLLRAGGYLGARTELHELLESDDDGRPLDVRALALVREYRELRLSVIDAQRQELLRLRSEGAYSSETLSHLLTILDADELGLEAGR